MTRFYTYTYRHPTVKAMRIESTTSDEEIRKFTGLSVVAERRLGGRCGLSYDGTTIDPDLIFREGDWIVIREDRVFQIMNDVAFNREFVIADGGNVE